MTETMREAVLALDDHRCQNCGSTEGLQVHEIKFRSEGGTLTPDNQITFCWKCHAIIENGRTVEGGWQSGRQFMLQVLKHHAQWSATFRWRKVYRWLRDVEERHRVSA